MTERLALIPLLAHPGPKSALFLGGGSQGAAELAMKAGGIDRSTVVELDRWLFRLAGRAMGKPHAPKNLEPVFGDGRVFAANTGEKFDLVVVCQPPPSTMGSNRYYTSQGFAALARVLAKGGAAVVVWPGMEDLAGKLQVMRLASVLKAAETAFSHVDWFAGPELMILLANQPGVLPGGSGQWVERLNRLGPGRAASVRPDTLAQGVSPLRLGLLKARLGQAGHIPANSDFRPLAVLLDPQLWGGLLGGRTDLAIAMLGLTPARLLWPLGAVIVFLAAALWMPGTGRFRLGAGVFMTGLTSMALSLMILFAYQAAFGSVYLGLALVMAGFMAGSAVAALALAPRLARLASPAAALAVTSVALALCCIGSWALAARLADAQCGLLGGFLLSAAAFIDGALTGAYFGLASGAGADQGLSGGKSAPLAGWLFGLDLAGGLLGALIPLALTASLGLKWAFVSLSVWSLAAALCPLRRA